MLSRLLAILAFSCLVLEASAAARLPAIFANDMVLQRGIDLPIWGWADPNETIQVAFAGQTQSTKADANGDWSLKLPPLKASAEGRDLTVTSADAAKPTITLTNVLVGDVWICSGQSNMQWPVRSSNNHEEEIAAANFPAVRLFFMSNTTANTPQTDCKGSWKICSPKTIPGFSAVGYFFGRHLHREIGVPIGLIGTSWGGTIAEAWTSEPSLRANLPVFNNAIENLKKEDPEQAKTNVLTYRERVQAYNEAIKKMYDIEEDFEAANKKAATETHADWKTMKVPGNWETGALPELDGIVWLRKTITIPEGYAGSDLILKLGPIDEVDTTWFNGVQVGTRGRSRTRDVQYWNIPRVYDVPGKLVKEGTNEIAIRVSDLTGQGGLWGYPAEKMVVEVVNMLDKLTLPLAGDWHYQVEVEIPPRPSNPNQPNRPTVLYNAMINPLVPYGITGAIWYQGESNAGRADQYRTLLPTLISDWRQHWGQGDFPFLIVQLANFQAVQPQPSESGWAVLREAQAITAANDPKVGLALAIDIGEAKDIHPRNKQEVGRRLGLAAQAIAYDQQIPYSGPVFKDMQINGNHATLTFDHTNGGLQAKDGPLTGFAIAGADKEFVWANAEIIDNTIRLSSPDIADPVHVRYAWAINPVANLYNGAGLPAVPFRTDAPTNP